MSLSLAIVTVPCNLFLSQTIIIVPNKCHRPKLFSVNQKKIYENFHRFFALRTPTVVRTDSPKSTKIFVDFREFTKIFVDFPKSTKIFVDFQISTKFVELRKSTKIFVDFTRSTKLFVDFLKSTKIFRRFFARSRL